MRVLKVQRKRHVSLPGEGVLPLRDARMSDVPRGELAFVLARKHVQEGQKGRPSECAIALCGKDHHKEFPGQFHGIWVYKTFSLVVTVLNDRRQAIRFVLPERLRRAINGFDETTEESLREGDTVNLLVPKKADRLGRSGGTSTPKSERDPVKNPRKSKGCHKRGVYLRRLEALQAEEDAKGTNSTVCIA